MKRQRQGGHSLLSILLSVQITQLFVRGARRGFKQGPSSVWPTFLVTSSWLPHRIELG